MNTAWINAPDAPDRGLVILSELVERVERLEQGRNPLLSFGNPEDSDIARDNIALKRQVDTLVDQNARFADRILELEAALGESLKNLEAVVAVQRGLL